SSGCTTARLPKLRATTCKAKAPMFVKMANSHNGCLTKSSRIAGDSAFSVLTRLVLRWSATDDIPKSSAATTAVTTATDCIWSSSGGDRPGRRATPAWASSELHACLGEAASPALVICTHAFHGFTGFTGSPVQAEANCWQTIRTLSATITATQAVAQI